MAVPIAANPVEDRIGGTEKSFHGGLSVCHSGFRLFSLPYTVSLVQITLDNKLPS
jgi:hypothetical protein